MQTDGGPHLEMADLPATQQDAATINENRLGASQLAPDLLCVAGLWLLIWLMFLPINQANLLPAGGDTVLFHIPAFYADGSLWNKDIGCGFPVASDPQYQHFYPLRVLFQAFGYNAFAMSAYFICSMGCYLFFKEISQSRLGAVCSAAAFTVSGFMISHLVHVTIIHSAAWFPWIMLSLVKLRATSNWRWFALGEVAVCLCILGGHLQVPMMAFFLAGAYSLYLAGANFASEQKRFLASVVLMFVLGIGLSAVQLIPTFELASQSLRAHMTFSEFVRFSFVPNQIATFVFPFIYGGIPPFRPEQLAYFGAWNPAEMGCYVGVGILLAAAFGACANFKRNWFWIALAALSLGLSLGDATPLSGFIYHVPIANLFRCPGRFLMLTDFALCAMASIGLSELTKGGSANRKYAFVALGAIAFPSLIFLTTSWLRLHHLFDQNSSVNASFRWFVRLAIALPSLACVVTAALIFFVGSHPTSTLRKIALSVVLIFDAASFGFSSLYDDNTSAAVLMPPPLVKRCADELSKSQFRSFQPSSYTGGIESVAPNLSSMWNLPTVSGYGPLALARYCKLFSTDGSGIVFNACSPEDSTIDLAGGKYVFTQHGNAIQIDTDLKATMLKDGKPTPFEMPPRFHNAAFGAVRIQSFLSGAADLKQNAPAFKVSAWKGTQLLGERIAYVGVDTADWAFDKALQEKRIRHRKPAPIESFTIDFGGQATKGYKYLLELKLPHDDSIDTLKIEPLMDRHIAIEKISLICPSRFSLVERVSPSVDMLRNERAVPRFHFAKRLVVLPSNDCLGVIKTSTFSNGARYSPADCTLIEKATGFIENSGARNEYSVEPIVDRNDRLELKTHSAKNAFLVISDTQYSGWEARLDGTITQLQNADYAFKGVAVPAGLHQVSLSYKPRAFQFGWAVTAFSLVLSLLPIFLRLSQWRRRQAVRRANPDLNYRT